VKVIAHIGERKCFGTKFSHLFFGYFIILIYYLGFSFSM